MFTKKGLVKNLQREGVKKMKKLIMMAVAVAMVISFLPKAEAGDTANLGLTVTFDQPSNRAPIIDPIPDQELKEGEPWSLQLYASDPDGDHLHYSFNYWDISMKGLEISEDGLLTWTPGYNQAGVYELDLIVSDIPDHPDDYIKTYFGIKVTVKEGDVISIELTPTTWELSEMRLGEIRVNRAIGGEVIHHFFNRGNVTVNVDIGYGPMADSLIHPGLEQGKDTFTTKTITRDGMKQIIPPNDKVFVGQLPPSDASSLPLHLIYGAPTELSPGIQGHKVTYELRAYKAE